MSLQEKAVLFVGFAASFALGKIADGWLSLLMSSTGYLTGLLVFWFTEEISTCYFTVRVFRYLSFVRACDLAYLVDEYATDDFSVLPPVGFCLFWIFFEAAQEFSLDL